MYLETTGVNVISRGKGGEVTPSPFTGPLVEEETSWGLDPETREISSTEEGGVSGKTREECFKT